MHAFQERGRAAALGWRHCRAIVVLVRCESNRLTEQVYGSACIVCGLAEVKGLHLVKWRPSARHGTTAPPLVLPLADGTRVVINSPGRGVGELQAGCTGRTAEARAFRAGRTAATAPHSHANAIQFRPFRPSAPKVGNDKHRIRIQIAGRSGYK